MKPRIRVKAICIPFVASSPNGPPASANSPQPRAEAGNNSVSDGVPATSPPEMAPSVTLALASFGTATTTVGRASTIVAADIPDLPAFLKRDGNNVPAYARAS